VLDLPVDGEIEKPCGLCLDRKRGRLYVGEGGDASHRVLVFDGVDSRDQTPFDCCVII